MDLDNFVVYWPIDKAVCPRCVAEPTLARIIEPYVGDARCSYCGGPGAAPVNVVLDAISDAIAADYTDPVNELPYESREGGYQGMVEDGSELVWEIIGDSIENQDLMEDLAGAFIGTAWCRHDYFGLDEYEILSYGWKGFVEQVKHRTRYLFLQELGEPDDADRETIPPGRMLDALGRLMQQFELYRTVPEGSVFYRARVHHPDQRLSTPNELGPPPRELAVMSNRMSPAGIPMFYGAVDEATAVAETFDPRREPQRLITIARFVTVRPLTLLDLTDLPAMPSPFDEENRYLRKPISFLREFVRDLAKPIQRDGYEHVEYVPTQVVTEFIRHRLTAHDGQKFDGIQYTSSRPGGHTAVVLFIEREQCGPRAREPYEPEISLLLDGFERRHP